MASRLVADTENQPQDKTRANSRAHASLSTRSDQIC